MINGQKLKTLLRDYGYDIDIIHEIESPRFITWHIQFPRHIKFSEIMRQKEDIAFSLQAAKALEIDAVFNTNLISITIPKKESRKVLFADVLIENKSSLSDYELPLICGVNIVNNIVIKDLAQMPHLLVSGQSGSGKTNFIHNCICNLISNVSSNKLKLMFIDMKGNELPRYNKTKYSIGKCATSPKASLDILYDLIKEMEARNLKPNKKYPHIVLVVDELADLMLDRTREVTERYLVLLAQKARSAKIHLVLSTQRPIVKVITGQIKANISSRISFSLPTSVDSRTILDQSGAESLLGSGDALLITTEEQRPVRLQVPYISYDEIDGVIKKNKD